MRSIIIVKSNKNKAIIELKQYVNHKWATTIYTKGYIGRNGVGKLKEGDGKTPKGLFRLGIAFGIYESIKTMLPYVKVQDSMYWIDDYNSKFYNELVKVETNKNNKEMNCKNVSIEEIDWKTAEHLIEYKKQYEYAIEIKYNEEKEREKGSAIFLHCSCDKPTAGCIAIPAIDMKKLLKCVNNKTKIYIM